MTKTSSSLDLLQNSNYYLLLRLQEVTEQQLGPKLSSRSVYSLDSQSRRRRRRRRGRRRRRRGRRVKHTHPERNRRSQSPPTPVWILLIHRQTSWEKHRNCPFNSREEAEERVESLSLSLRLPVALHQHVTSSSRFIKGKPHHHHRGGPGCAHGLCSPFKLQTDRHKEIPVDQWADKTQSKSTDSACLLQ